MDPFDSTNSRRIRGRPVVRDELDQNIYNGGELQLLEDDRGKNGHSNRHEKSTSRSRGQGQEGKGAKQLAADLDLDLDPSLELELDREDAPITDTPNPNLTTGRQKKRFSITDERRVSINRYDAAVGLDPSLLDQPDESPSPPRPSKAANKERPSILDRMVSNHLTAPPPASAFSKVKTTTRGLSAFKTPALTTPPSILQLQPQEPQVSPKDMETTDAPRKKKSSRRKTPALIASTVAPKPTPTPVLPLTEGNLRRSGFQREEVGAPSSQKKTNPLQRPQPNGPLFQKRSNPRSKSLGKERRSHRTKSGKDQENVRSKALEPGTSHFENDVHSPSQYNPHVHIRVVSQAICAKPTLPQEDSPVSASFLKALKVKPPTWGALAKELSQGNHSVDVPILSFSHSTGADELIQFGLSGRGDKRAVLMGVGHERQIHRMKDALVSRLHFTETKITVLLNPKKNEILQAFSSLAHTMDAFDSLVIYYIGEDQETAGSERLGNNDPRILVPADHEVSGLIKESDFWEKLVKPIQHPVQITCILDCPLPTNAFDLKHTLEDVATPLARPGTLQRSSSSRSQHQDERDMINALGGMLELAANLSETDQIARPHLQYNRDRRTSRATALATLLTAKPHYGAHASLQVITATSDEGKSQPGETTAALVQVLTDLHDYKITIESLLFHIRMLLTPNRIPQIKSHRPIDFHAPFAFYQDGERGKRRALLVGINYPNFPYARIPNPELEGTPAAELEGAHIDLHCFKLFLEQTYDYREQDLIVLLDDEIHEAPTRGNILTSMQNLVKESVPGDSVVFYFVGQGTSDAVRECIYPVDFEEYGVISGDNLWQEFVEPMSDGVEITCVIDAPTPKGNVIELPYSFEADDEQAKLFIPATVHVIGGTQGGISKPFVQTMMQENQLNWFSALDSMQEIASDRWSPDQNFVLSASRKLNKQSPVNMIPNQGDGVKRALLIGINYVAQADWELHHCHEELVMYKMYLQRCHGLTGEEMTVLQDRGLDIRPTRRNILHAIEELVENTQPGDSLFLYYCGHGNAVMEKMFGSREHVNGEKWEEALIPSDIDKSGRNAILDDELLNVLVRPLPEGSRLTCVIDCYKSHSAINLPYSYRPPAKRKQTRSTSPFRRLSLGNALFPNDSNKKGGALSGIISGAWSSLKNETHDFSSSSLDYSDGRSSARS